MPCNCSHARRTPRTPELIQHFLSSLESPSKRLSPWELNFLESVSDQFSRRGDLSEKQFEILERLYSEKTA